nr:MAG TPA_asm: ParB protein [Caudoviricetes sp.]
MTKPRDYFTGKQEEFKRSDVQIAPYNPRKISPQQKATLKRSIRKYGVVGGITVNKNTMTIVGGNQKVAIMDEIMGYPEKDYTLLAEAIDVDYKTEVELNLMLNSENAHGEWDDMKVRDLLPDINYLDAGLTEEDLSLFGFDAMVITEGEKELEKELNALIESPSDIYDNIQSEDKKVSASKKEQAELKKEIEQNQIIANQMQDAQYQANKERMQQVKQEVKTKAAGKAMESEAYVMLAFDNVDNKERFMHTFGFVETDKVIKGEILMKVAKHV